MKRRWARVGVIIGVVAVLQIGAILVYRAVERGRAPPTPFHAEALGGELAPVLALEGPDGLPVSLAEGPRVRLVHFWATWCGPCVTELPGLLALARRLRPRGLELVAISVNDDWGAIRTFFHDSVPGEVLRARDPIGYKRYGVSGLPDTYLVTADGRIVERFGGARDWNAPEAERHLIDRLQTLMPR